jgi:hypothetical protein
VASSTTTPPLQQLWAKVANEALERTGDEGRAIREANAVGARQSRKNRSARQACRCDREEHVVAFGGDFREHRLTDINALVDESLTRAYYNARAEQRGFTIKLEKGV